MPRSWDYWERRAEEKYYDYLYSECRCYNYEDELCPYCTWEEKKQEEAERAETIRTIRAQIDAVQNAVGLGFKLPALRILLTNLLSQKAFLASTPKFRKAVVNKVKELRADPLATPLTELFDHMDTMLEGLTSREDYKE